MNSQEKLGRRVHRPNLSPIVTKASRLLGFSLHPCHAFRVFGGFGLALGIGTAMAVAVHLNLSPSLTLVLAISSLAAFLATAIIAKILTGQESFIYLRELISVLVTLVVLLRLLDQRVLPYLDVIALGIGTFLAFGRIGCLLVGCCHGRPARWGIRYSSSHADCGFPSHYVGVRLFPIQAVESLFVFSLVAIGIAIVWKGAAPGTVLTFYLAAYAVGRFFIEFARGDAARPFLFYFSEAQWTSALLLWTLVLAETFHLLPKSIWLLPAAAALTLIMAVLTLARRLTPNHRFRLRHPHHVRELAQALHQLSQLASSASGSKSAAAPPPRINLFTTTCGIQLSGGTLRQSTQNQNLHHYCLSASHTALTKSDAQTLSTLIVRLLDLPRPAQLLERKPGIFHLFI